MNKLLKKTLKILLPVALGGFILYWVYRDFDFARAKEVLLHGTNWGWMLFSLFFGVMSHVFRGWRWKQTLAPLGAYPKSGDCVDAIFVSYAANLILPRVGEVSRCGVLAKYDDVSFAKSLGTVVTERLIDTLTIIVITGITFLIQMPVFLRFFEETGTKVPSLVHLVTSPWFYVVLFSIIGVLVLLYFLLRMLSFFEKVKGVVLNVWEGVMSLKSVKNIPLFILYTLFIWICYFYHFYITFYCFSFTELSGRLGDVCGRHFRSDCSYSQWCRFLALCCYYYDDVIWCQCYRCRSFCVDSAWYTDIAGYCTGYLWMVASVIGQSFKIDSLM